LTNSGNRWRSAGAPAAPALVRRVCRVPLRLDYFFKQIEFLHSTFVIRHLSASDGFVIPLALHLTTCFFILDIQVDKIYFATWSLSSKILRGNSYSMSIYRNWFLASRPWSFTMTAISVSVGSALGAIDGDFSWPFYLITLLGTVLLHAATNLINDYYDVKSGVDTWEVSTARYRPHPLVEGKLKLAHVGTAAVVLYAVSTCIGIYLAASRGWTLMWIGLIGAFASLTYTAPPLKYKYSALGEISVFFMWGPLMVLGAYFVQRQRFSMDACWISFPFGALVALVLLANNIRDINHDRDKGILTLAIILG
jgi:1,4-dihydroxy-2-naphthoate octaprenyltransferase